MLRVELIETTTRTKHRVVLNDETEWLLYSSDLRRYHITVGAEISESLREEIQHTCITVRARKHVLALLEKMDRTEADLRSRLRRSGYEPDVVEDAINYAKKFGYIDDDRYANHYIQAKSGIKSRRQIEAELKQKGIHHLPENAFQDSEAEKEAVRRLINRKTYDVDSLNTEQKQKIAASLYRKGFPSELIRKELHM